MTNMPSIITTGTQKEGIVELTIDRTTASVDREGSKLDLIPVITLDSEQWNKGVNDTGYPPDYPGRTKLYKGPNGRKYKDLWSAADQIYKKMNENRSRFERLPKPNSKTDVIRKICDFVYTGRVLNSDGVFEYSQETLHSRLVIPYGRKCEKRNGRKCEKRRKVDLASSVQISKGGNDGGSSVASSIGGGDQIGDQILQAMNTSNAKLLNGLAELNSSRERVPDSLARTIATGHSSPRKKDVSYYAEIAKTVATSTKQILDLERKLGKLQHELDTEPMSAETKKRKRKTSSSLKMAIQVHSKVLDGVHSEMSLKIDSYTSSDDSD
mmetsp:Transcript_3471/g.5161  ORF Transcript_3471/g.5161 Transcript_3471/m.5161 type:complete len:325 (-) Transcript_3471:89-1063(-)